MIFTSAINYLISNGGRWSNLGFALDSGNSEPRCGNFAVTWEGGTIIAFDFTQKFRSTRVNLSLLIRREDFDETVAQRETLRLSDVGPVNTNAMLRR